MKTRLMLWTVLLGALCALGGCWVVSLEPLASPDKTQFDPALLGDWKTDDGDMLSISQGEDGGYDIAVVPKDVGEEGMDLHAELVSLGTARFLDCRLSGDDADRTSGRSPLLLSTSMVLKFTLEGGTLRLRSPKPDWFETRSKAGTLDTPYALSQGGVVLTGTTAQLQKFFEGIAPTADAWDDSPGDFKRATENAGGAPDAPDAPKPDR